jgi:AcrR family transcriptional regulator
VLDAAGELFTTRGYAATSTRLIADAVGIRQASLYYYFRTKDDILAALLSTTVVQPLSANALLDDLRLPPQVHLHALCRFDCTQLWENPWNLGILYLLPEVRAERFEEFHQQRAQLRRCYRRLSGEVIAGVIPDEGRDVFTADATDDVVFRLTETLPNLRADGFGHDDQPLRTADLGLHSLGWSGSWSELRAESDAAFGHVTANIATS